MSNNKQSSVEYLMDKLFDPSSMVEEQLEWFEQAKAMHKEEMEHFFKMGMSLVEGHLWKPIDKFEECYEQTYGGNK